MHCDIFSRDTSFYIMTYRKCCIFTGRKSWVHQALYTAGVGDIYHMIQMIKNVVCSSIIFLFYYSLLRSFHSAEKTWYKNEMSLLWHNIFCITKTSDAKLAFHYYPLTNEVAKGYSNATFHLSFLLSVRPSFRNIFVNTLESTSFNGFWPNLVHTKRIWNPIDFQGQRSRSLGQIFRQGDMPRFALPLF
jgi:hypothetical protein